MKTCLLFLFLTIPFLAYSQIPVKPDTGKVVTYYREGVINESYTLNAKGKKEGAYERNTRYGKKYIRGQYANGNPVGVWEFFSSDTTGVLVQKLDFNSHKELFVDSLRVPALICGPRYFGGNMIKQEYIQNAIKEQFTEAEREMYKGQTFSVMFSIDKITLKPIGVSCTDAGISEDIRKKMELIVSQMPAWLPPVCKESSEVWRFSVAFVF